MLQILLLLKNYLWKNSYDINVGRDIQVSHKLLPLRSEIAHRLQV